MRANHLAQRQQLNEIVARVWIVEGASQLLSVHALAVEKGSHDGVIVWRFRKIISSINGCHRASHTACRLAERAARGAPEVAGARGAAASGPRRVTVRTLRRFLRSSARRSPAAGTH